MNSLNHHPNHNPILQAISLANSLGALAALISAVDTVNTGALPDPNLLSIRMSLVSQEARSKAELDALVNLYAPAQPGQNGV